MGGPKHPTNLPPCREEPRCAAGQALGHMRQKYIQKIYLAFFQFVLVSQKQVPMDHSPFPLPHLPAITTLTRELKAALN